MGRNLSVYLCYLLRHHPEKAGLDMDVHGWVSVDQLIRQVDGQRGFSLDKAQLESIVAQDEKGRYRFNQDHSRIKCCQGHSIPWIQPELAYGTPPPVLYHGTNTAAMKKIDASGAIQKMKRHAVHLQPTLQQAWQSAERWHLVPVVLKVDAAAMDRDGFSFGMADNQVWCTESVPTRYICDRIFFPQEETIDHIINRK